MAARPGRRAAGARALYSPRHAKTKSRGGGSFLGTFIDGGFIAVCVLIFGLLTRMLVGQLYTVPSGSMENTLRIGDTVVVNRLAPGVVPLRRGDVVVFRDPGGWLSQGNHREHREGTPRTVLRSALVFIGLIPQHSGEHLVKRVIGLAGDTVECDGRGTLTVNRVPQAETYVHPGERSCETPFRVTVPRGGLWVMGDHRSMSADSRFHRDRNNGAVPMGSVVGRVIAVWHEGGLRLL